MKKSIATALIAFAMPAFAADPGVPKEAKELQCLVGSWKGQGTMKTPDGQSMTMQVALDCKAAAGGYGVACHGKFTAPGMPAYEEDDLFGYNAGDGLYHWFSITNQGETHDHKGGLSDNAFVGEYSGPQGGALFEEQVKLAFQGDKKINFTSACTLGGKNAGVLEGTLTK